MSIGIYAFLRIYFFSFGLSAFAQFRTRPTPSSAAACAICKARAVWYRLQTGAACPAFGRVCRALSGLLWFWHGLRCAVCSGALGLGSPPAGYMGRAGGGAVDTSRRKNSKKAFFGVRVANTHPTFTKRNLSDCASLQKFQKIQKDPFRSLDCAIITLWCHKGGI